MSSVSRPPKKTASDGRMAPELNAGTDEKGVPDMFTRLRPPQVSWRFLLG